VAKEWSPDAVIVGAACRRQAMAPRGVASAVRGKVPGENGECARDGRTDEGRRSVIEA